MYSFRHFYESLSKRPDNWLDLSIDTTNTKSGESISTFQPPKLRSTADKSKTLGKRVFYAYSYQSSSDITDILNSFKGNGPLRLNRIKQDLFIDKTAKYMAEHLKTLGFDVIAAPNSSSHVVKLFAYKLGKYLGVEVIYDSLNKLKVSIPDDKEAALKFIRDNFIDHSKIASEYKGDQAQKEKMIRELSMEIRRQFTKNGEIKAKNLHKQTAKFVYKFMKPSAHSEYKYLYKNVLVVDDSLSSGGTMKEMLRIIMNELGASEVSGAVLFSQRSK